MRAMRAEWALGGFRVIAVAAITAAAVFALHRTLLSDRLPTFAHEPFAPPTPSGLDTEHESSGAMSGDAAEETFASPSPAAEQPGPERSPGPGANPHREALRHPSPSYRNVSLTALIREAGYVCFELLSATAGNDDFGPWRVSCDEGRAYLVSEDGAGGLRVEPMAYFDQPVPFIERQAEPPQRVLPAPQNGPPPRLPVPQQ